MFQKLIVEIIKTGMTEDDIGQRVGASQASINRIKSGTQNPKYDLGAALVVLHKDVVTQPAPVENHRVLKDQRAGKRRSTDFFNAAKDEKAA